MTFDPFSGLSRQWKDIPDWQKGSKVSLSSDDGSTYRDSSDEAGRSSSDDSDADPDTSGDGYDIEAVGLDVEKTPRAKAKAPKRADLEKVTISSAETAIVAGQTSTIKRRPRASSISSPSSSGSSSGGRSLKSQPGLGPAAKNFSNWTANQSQPVSFNSSSALDSPSTPFSLASSSSAPGPSAQISATRKLNRKRTGGLDRATSAPSGLFSSPPASKELKAKGSPDNKTSAIEESDSDSGHASQCVDKVIDAAFAAVSGDVELANCGLYNLPSTIGSMRHMVTHDPRSGMSYSTPIHLTLSNNYLTAQGLPPALFQIYNLASLFLRANQLDDLPSAIGDLTNLKHLSVAVNKLKYLPAEILQLKLDTLTASPNRFIPYSSVLAAKPKEEDESDASTVASRKCSIRKHNFRVPSLVELCTRQLLAEVPEPTLKRKSFSPSVSNVQTKRYFHQCKEEAISPRTDAAPVPGHLLKPFLPLLQPLPHHLRYLLKEQNAFSQHSNFVQSCSVCKTPCSQFAEERLEWRYEIAGQKVADQNDPEQWIPVKWRGCSANCLDFLDE